jgi:hypothetical protein
MFIIDQKMYTLNRATVHCLRSLDPSPPAVGSADRKARLSFFFVSSFEWWGRSCDLVLLLLSLLPLVTAIVWKSVWALSLSSVDRPAEWMSWELRSSLKLFRYFASKFVFGYQRGPRGKSPRVSR